MRTPEPATSEIVWENVDEVWIGRFALEGLEGRAYRVSLAGFDGHGNSRRIEREVTPSVASLRPGEGAALFRIDDAVAESDVSVLLVDSETEIPIEAFTATLFAPDPRHPAVRRQVFEGVASFERLSAPEAREIYLEVRGYRPRHLPAGSLAAEGGEHVFALRRGWGAMVVALGPENVPVAGAEVWVDEVLVGTTGEGGWLLIEQDSLPEKVRVCHPDWVLERSRATDPQTDQLLPGSRRSGDSLLFHFASRGE